MSDQEVILLKLGMGRNPTVDVTVSFSVLIEVCEYYFKRKEAISHIVGSTLEAVPDDPKTAIYISELRNEKITSPFFSCAVTQGGLFQPL